MTPLTREQIAWLRAHYVLVPRKATPAMLRAGFLTSVDDFAISQPSDAPGLVWGAMITAADSIEHHALLDIAEAVSNAPVGELFCGFGSNDFAISDNDGYSIDLRALKGQRVVVLPLAGEAAP